MMTDDRVSASYYVSAMFVGLIFVFACFDPIYVQAYTLFPPVGMV